MRCVQGSLDLSGVRTIVHSPGAGGNVTYILPTGYVYHMADCPMNCKDSPAALERLLGPYPDASSKSLSSGQIAGIGIGKLTLTLDMWNSALTHMLCGNRRCTSSATASCGPVFSACQAQVVDVTDNVAPPPLHFKHEVASGCAHDAGVVLGVLILCATALCCLAKRKGWLPRQKHNKGLPHNELGGKGGSRCGLQLRSRRQCCITVPF